MNKDECFYIGTITKVLGYKGELVVRLDDSFSKDLKNPEFIFIEIDRRNIRLYTPV